MLPHHSQYSKYTYIQIQSFWVKCRFIISLVAFIMTVIGNYYFLSSNLLISITFGSMFLFLTIYFGLSYSLIITGYKSFDLEKHNQQKKLFWNDNLEPSVDIFLPICGEHIDVINNTWQGVKELCYTNINVYVLDDKGDKEYELLAKKFGFNYLSRPDKGQMKKAGNLKYGYEHSDSQFVVIFDADFRPHPDFLTELLPYMAHKEYGIIQSPQYFSYSPEFHDKQFIEYGAGVVQEDFYKIIQPSRNTYHGAICVGSNAIYRRSALDTIGGTAQVEHSEDVLTGFKLWGQGYKTHYIPLILASGLCPDNFTAYFKQQNRWCSGSMTLLKSRDFWTTNMPLMMRLCYLSGMSYYITQFTYFIVPLQIYCVIWLYGNIENSWYILWFLPAILNGYILFPAFRKNRLRVGGRFVFLTQHYIFTLTVIYTLLLNKTLGWTPSGKKQKRDTTLESLVNFSFIYSTILLVLAGVSFYFGKIDFHKMNNWFTYFWAILAITTHFTWGIISKWLIQNEQSETQRSKEIINKKQKVHLDLLK